MGPGMGPGKQPGGSAGASTISSPDGGPCAPGVVGPVITDCGYPYQSAKPLTNVSFNEDEVLRAIVPSGGSPLASIRVFYNDEHALTLGVRSVVAGGKSTDYPVSALVTDPDSVRYPQTGTNLLTGDQSGLDPSARPMWPSLFVTDITNDLTDRSGDWQQGGTPWNPNVIFGSWKSAVRTVDGSTVSITPDADPAKNDWNLPGGDTVPSGLKNEGYGAEARWDLVLIAGHSYRIQVIVHDGDQNKVGGDSGEACVDFCADAACPEGSDPCVPGGEHCTRERSCFDGCCL